MTERLTFDELAGRLVRCPAEDSLWEHYKTGRRYFVVGRAIHEATLEALVIYEPFDSPIRFARPLAEWREVVEHDGRRVERFREVVP